MPEMKHDNEEGWSPVFTKEIGFVMIASNHNFPQFSIFEIDNSEEIKTHKLLKNIDKDLDTLILSAAKFPPLLAYAKNKLEKYKNEIYSQKEFCSIFKDIINITIKDYGSRRFLFCKCKEDDFYLTKNEYYWIVEIDGNNKKAKWVSDDYYIYSDSIDLFEIEGNLTTGSSG